MINKWIINAATIFGILFLSSCGLPVVTPPVESYTPTSTPFVAVIAGNPSPTTAPVPVPVEITAKNAASLTATYISAVSNAQQLKWARDGLSLAVSTQNFDSDGNQLFGVTLLNVPELVPADIYTTQTEWISDVASNGKMAALVSLDSTYFTLIDLSAENTTLFTISPDYRIGNVSFSPDSSILAVSKVDAWEVGLYSTADGSEIKNLTGFETAAPIYQARFKESPQWMTWLARATLQLQEIETGKLGPKLEHSDSIMAYTLSSDGSMVATASTIAQGDVPVAGITVWDAAGAAQLRTLVLSESAQCLSFSPDGNLLAVGAGSTLQIWDVTSGDLVATLTGHTGMIGSLAFSPDGKYLATAGQDNQLFLWQVSE